MRSEAFTGRARSTRAAPGSGIASVRKRSLTGASFITTRGRYEKALVYFRRAAVADPETPHLASYLIRTEHQILRQKTALEDIPMETVSEKPIASAASAAPTPPQAAPALSNPAEAQKHYEAGLIAYAKNELNEAKRHWVITCRLNKEHPKAAQALKRVQDEIAIENHKPR